MNNASVAKAGDDVRKVSVMMVKSDAYEAAKRADEQTRTARTRAAALRISFG